MRFTGAITPQSPTSISAQEKGSSSKIKKREGEQSAEEQSWELPVTITVPLVVIGKKKKMLIQILFTVIKFIFGSQSVVFFVMLSRRKKLAVNYAT